MGNYFFYGTLRSISVLEKVIGKTSNHLDIIPAFAPKSELPVSYTHLTLPTT